MSPDSYLYVTQKYDAETGGYFDIDEGHLTQFPPNDTRHKRQKQAGIRRAYVTHAAEPASRHRLVMRTLLGGQLLEVIFLHPRQLHAGIRSAKK